MTDPDKLDLLRRLFSDHQATRQAAMDEWAPQPGPLFQSPAELAEALRTLEIEPIKKGGEHNGQQRQQSPHQA